MRRATIFAFVLIAASSVSLAQDKALISGYVHNNKNKALRDVEVHLTNASLRLDRMATTDEDGYYLFPLVDPSPCPQDQPEECYEVTASMPGKTFVPQRQQLAVEVGETRVIVPTFEEQPSADAVSRLRSRPQPNFGDQTGGVGGGVLTEARAKQSTSSAPTSLPSGHVVPAVLSGRSTPMPTAITYVPGRQAASIIWLNIEQQRAIHGLHGCLFPPGWYPHAFQSVRHPCERPTGVANHRPTSACVEFLGIRNHRLHGATASDGWARFAERMELKMKYPRAGIGIRESCREA